MFVSWQNETDEGGIPVTKGYEAKNLGTQGRG